MHLSFGRVLRACLIAGLVAGLAAAIVTLTVVEPAITPALEIEEARPAAPAHEHTEAGAAPHSHGDEAVVSRAVQIAVGALVAVIGGVIFGSLFAVAFGLLRGRLAGRTDFARAVVLAAIGWAVFALFPAIKIPANPPAVGDAETVGMRSAIYAGVLVAGVVIAVVGHVVHGRLSARGTAQPARAAGTAAVVAVLVVAALVLIPWSPDSIPADVPAAVVWDFRLASLAQLTTLWAVLGLSAGWLLTREARRSDGRSRDPVSTAA